MTRYRCFKRTIVGWILGWVFLHVQFHLGGAVEVSEEKPFHCLDHASLLFFFFRRWFSDEDFFGTTYHILYFNGGSCLHI